jgi:sulfur carrier protein
MEVVVNGDKQMVQEGTTVAGLLEELRLSPERVVVEVNLAILKRAQHPSIALKEGDQVEIVHFVGGGAIGYA